MKRSKNTPAPAATKKQAPYPRSPAHQKAASLPEVARAFGGSLSLCSAAGEGAVPRRGEGSQPNLCNGSLRSDLCPPHDI